MPSISDTERTEQLTTILNSALSKKYGVDGKNVFSNQPMGITSATLDSKSADLLADHLIKFRAIAGLSKETLSVEMLPRPKRDYDNDSWAVRFPINELTNLNETDAQKLVSAVGEHKNLAEALDIYLKGAGEKFTSLFNRSGSQQRTTERGIG